MSASLNVLAVIETSAGAPRDASFELLAAAADLRSDSVSALVIGQDVSGVAEKVAGLGASRVLLVDGDAFVRYSTACYTEAIEAAIAVASPSVVLLAGTTAGRDLGPYLAARRGQEALVDCVRVARDGDRLVGVRPVFQGKMVADVSIPLGDPAFVVIRSGAYGEPETAGAAGSVERLDVTMVDAEQPVEFVGLTQAKGGDAHLEDADVVVVGGRGVGSAEQYQIILDLAEAIGGTVGATRAVTDLGWRPHHEQIGQTGAHVRPKLYIGVGVSGAVQHAVGMQNAETIVAINRDPDAPLFRMAEIGVVGDLHEILPHLISELRSVRAGAG
jgi:electron transfer flavoprotein alpha subunit